MDHSYEIINAKKELLEESEDDPESIIEENQLSENDKNEELDNGEKDKSDDQEDSDLLSNQMGMDGVNQFLIKLINLVKSHPNIYDKFDPNFRSNPAKEKSWKEIAEALNTSISFAQNRWIRLRERFARERKALDIMQKSGNVNNKKKLWPYFLPLLFLSSHIKARRTCVSGGNSSNDYTSNDDFSDFLNTITDKSKDDSSSPSTSGVESSKRTVEVIDEFHPEYLAWKKKNPSDNVSSQPRKIMAKPDGSLTTVMLAAKSKDGANKILTKLPPGAILIKNSAAMKDNPVLLFPSPSPNMTLAKSPSLPTSMFVQAAPNFASQPKPAEPKLSSESAEHHFGLLIAKELERYPLECRNRKKQKILMALYE